MCNYHQTMSSSCFSAIIKRYSLIHQPLGFVSESKNIGLVSSVVAGFSASDTSSLSEAEAMSFNYPVMVTSSVAKLI